MNMTRTGEIPESAQIARLRKWRKFCALGISFAACLVLFSLLCTFTVKGFKSQVTIPVAVGESEDNVQSLYKQLPGVIQKVSSSTNLRLILDGIENSSLHSLQKPERDIEQVRDAISVVARPGIKPGIIGLTVVFAGKGNEVDQQIARSVADDLIFLLQSSVVSQSEDQIAFNTPTPVPNQRLERLNSLMLNLEQDLKTATRSIESLAVDSDAASPFRNASYSKESQQAYQQARETLSTVDLELIRNEIDQLKQSRQLDQKTRLIKTDHVLSIPTGGVPGRKQLLLMGMAALLFGAVVSWSYDPFADSGFTSASQVASSLKVPVVAVLHGTAGDATDRRFANQIVDAAYLFVFSAAVLTAGFCVINEEVREAFVVNPFHGLARMVWVFIGH